MIEIDDDEDEVEVIETKGPPAAVTASSAAASSAADDRAAVARARALADGNDSGTAEWSVRRGGRFVAYGADVQAEMEEAFMRGDGSVPITIHDAKPGDAGGSTDAFSRFIIDLDRMRQQVAHDTSRWRPVRRQLTSGQEPPAGGSTVASSSSSAPSTSAAPSTSHPPSTSAAPSTASTSRFPPHIAMLWKRLLMWVRRAGEAVERCGGGWRLRASKLIRREF